MRIYSFETVEEAGWCQGHFPSSILEKTLGTRLGVIAFCAFLRQLKVTNLAYVYVVTSK